MFSTLSLTNFKGVNREYRFRTGNLILGPNFSGKSAIDQALRCLALNYVPDMAKTSAAMKMFASDYPMRISTKTYNERGPGNPSNPEFSIAFDRVKSTVKQTEDNAMKLDEPTRVMFDPSIFFGLADSARISKACQLVMTEGGNMTDLIGDVQATLFLDAEAMAKSPLLDAYKTWQAAAVAAKTINDLLAGAETYWKAQKTTQAAEKLRQQKLTEGLSDATTVEAELAKLPARHVVEAAKKKLDAEVQALTEKITLALTTGPAAKTRAEDRARVAAVAAQLETRRTEMTTAEAAHQKAQEARDTAATIHNTALAEWRAAKADEPKPAAPPPAPVPEERTDDFTTGAAREREYPAKVRLRLNEDGQPEIVEIISWTDEGAPVAPVQVDHEAEQAAAYEHTQRVNEAYDKVVDAQAALDKAKADVQSTYRSLQVASSAFHSANSNVTELARIDALPPIEVVEHATIQAWTAERDQKSEERRANDTTIESIVRFEQDAARIKQAAAKREEIELTIKTIGKVVELIAQKKQEIVSGSIEAPLAIANKLSAGILKGPLVFQEGELGMLQDGKFVSQRVFSGTETALVMMGLTAGLAHKSQLRVLMLDELGRLDTRNQAALLTNLVRMVDDGDIDQFIVIGPDNKDLVAAASAAFDESKLKIFNID